MHHPLSVHATSLPLPAGRRLPFAWQAAPIGRNLPLTLAGPLSGRQRLRVAIALDDRLERTLLVRAVTDGSELARIDCRFASVFQVCEVHIDGADLAHGVTLTLAEDQPPLWIFTVTDARAPLLAPHVCADRPGGGALAAAHDRLCSFDSIQPFGWMEGCVLDGLCDLAEATGAARWGQAAERRLARFISADGSLRYENPRSEPADGTMYGIEGGLPFAALARLHPGHPALAIPAAFWRERRAERGAIHDHHEVSAEGCYTVAYPLAMCAGRHPEFAAWAVEELRRRHRLLRDGEDVWLRYYEDSATRSFRHWSRGLAWVLLGTVRTLLALGEAPDDLRHDLVRLVHRVLVWQRPDGLWSNIADEPSVTADTSGSAGLAAGLALAARHDLLPVDLRGPAVAAALHSRSALRAALTPDGFLTGVAPINKGGESLQRSDYRVIAAFGLGLMAQLEAALSPRA
jgi:unsaturated rhamnogalacturonyl hydrolase